MRRAAVRPPHDPAPDGLADRFAADGFVVVPAALGAQEVATAVAELDAVLDDIAAEGGSPARPAGEVPAVAHCLQDPDAARPAIRALATHPTLAAVATRLIGPDVKCIQSQLFVKPPGAPGNPWHQDERPLPTRDRSLVAVWIALEPAHRGNGCLRVVPSSHRPSTLLPTRPHSRPADYDFDHEAFGFDDRKAVDVELDAGDAVFFDGYLVHGSLPNRSAQSRRALTFHYMSAHSYFPQRAADEGKQAKNRVHLDVRAAPDLEGDERMAALEAGAERLVAQGATRLGRHEPAPPLDAGHIVMADPEGNEFCLD